MLKFNSRKGSNLFLCRSWSVVKMFQIVKNLFVGIERVKSIYTMNIKRKRMVLKSKDELNVIKRIKKKRRKYV